MHKKKVLIVEDAEYMSEMLEKMLNKEYEIVGKAVNGLDAIKKYEELKPDIVTMDIRMKKMNGIEAIKEIKKIDSNAIISVISAFSKDDRKYSLNDKIMFSHKKAGKEK